MSISAASQDPVRAAAPGIVFLARVGYAAKGVVYLIIGFLAARLAFGSGGGEVTDQSGALRVIGGGPFGRVALLVVGVGLLGYMTWRLVSAATDAERRGDDPTSIVVRLGHAIRGIAYGLLGVQALRAMAGGSSSGEGGRAESLTSRLFELPFGTALVYVAALGFVAYAGYQLYRASSEKKVRAHLDLHEAGPAQARWIVRIGQFGIAARAVVFALLGLFLVRAARQHDSSEAGGFSDSLLALADAPYGRVALGTVALGLVAYGVYELATARYRHMRAV